MSSNPQVANNPFYSNVLKLAENKDEQALKQIAQNMAKEKGLDFDQEFSNFIKQMNIK